MNRNENEAESFAGNFMAFGEEALFFEVPISTTSNANLRCCLAVIDQLLFPRCKQSARLPSFAGFIESRGLGICWLGC